MTATTVTPAGERAGRPTSISPRLLLLLLYGLASVAAMSIARIGADNPDLTSSGTFGTGLRTAAPIALAGLSALFAERSGTVNIGVEGMMVMGTIFAGWWGWQYGPWMAIVGGILGGAIAGLLMSVATTTFGVNHIVAGFAINILAPGVARFMANELFTDAPGGSISNSPGNKGDIGRFTMPFTSGGDLFKWRSPDVLGWFEEQRWFFVSDLAALLKGLTSNLSLDVVITALVFVLAGYVIWRTPFGLRLRAAGERPSAADSLGVSVYKMRYAGMAISGGLAGMGGAVLVLFANRYQQDQTNLRGFLGIATMIIGNWRPAGTAAAAGLFGYAQGIVLRTNPELLVRALILAAAIGLAMTVLLLAARRRWTGGAILLVITVVVFWAFYVTEEPSNQLVFVTPYVVTLIAVSIGARRLRPPAEEGVPWHKGQL